MGLDGRVNAWSVVMPVKVLASAKSRLSVASPELALAFFIDTASAARDSSRVAQVVVVTDDDTVRAAALAIGCDVVGDPPSPGINAAARVGMAAGRGGRVAVIVSDLPTLTPSTLDAVLASAERYPECFLADLDGTGTTMWMAAAGGETAPMFGDASRATHRAVGAVDLVDRHPEQAATWMAARRDIDTEEALHAARLLGVGPATTLALDPST
jgi:2-phospho-L-lactate guanylyltransferase